MKGVIPRIDTNTRDIGTRNYVDVLPSGLSPEARAMVLYASQVAEWKRAVL